MSYTIIRPKTREEWLDVRKGGIGSSEVGTIIGLNPFETPYQLWLRKTGRVAPNEGNLAMRAGHFLEDAVAQFFVYETAAQIIKASQGDWIMQDNDKPYLQVSPDRTYWRIDDKHNEASKGILECKTTSRQIDKDFLPLHWVCQITYQLGVAGYDHGALAWLTQGREFGYQDINFNKDFYDYLVANIDEFWYKNIKQDIEPEAVTAEDVMLKYPKELNSNSVTADEQIAESIIRLKKVKEEIKVLDTEKSQLEDKLKLFIGENEGIISSTGEKMATFKANKDSLKFDEKRFRDENLELYNRYLITKTGARILRLK